MRSTLLILAAVACLSARDVSPGTEVFAGSTLCGGIIRPLLNIPPEADCALVEWKLTLYRDPVTQKPSSYKLEAVHRFVVKATNMYSKPGNATSTQGKWAIISGIKNDPEAIVYQLDPGIPQRQISLYKFSPDHLHVLDKNGALMIGDGSASYTLNRIP